MESVSRIVSAVSWIDARDTLRKWREDGSRKSSKTVKLARDLLMHRKSDLGNEVWPIYEQTCTAALDCGDFSLAKECLKNLKKQFPDSVKVSMLQGLYLEAEEKYSEANTLYDEIIDAHPSCSAAWKRKVAILVARGKTLEAIKELNEFLNVFMSDTEAWLELADLYIKNNEYGRAGFCLEELLLTNPHHYLYHLKYAEICYSIGSERIELARKHYATAVKLNPSSLRALYGFYLSCQWIGPKSKQIDSKSKNHQYMEWAKVQIKKCYQFDDHKLRIVERMLDK